MVHESQAEICRDKSTSKNWRLTGKPCVEPPVPLSSFLYTLSTLIRKKGLAKCETLLVNDDAVGDQAVSFCFLRRRQAIVPIPASPIPSRKTVAGSGVTVG